VLSGDGGGCRDMKIGAWALAGSFVPCVSYRRDLFPDRGLSWDSRLGRPLRFLWAASPRFVAGRPQRLSGCAVSTDP